VTQIVLESRPELIEETLRDARLIAEALDGVWAHLDRIVRTAEANAAPNGSLVVERQADTRDARSTAAEDAALLRAAAAQGSEVCLAES